MNTNEIVISSQDAAVLSALVNRAVPAPGTEEAVEELAVALEVARIVDAARLPGTVVSLGTQVDYVELPEGRQRTVTLVPPAGADPGRAHVSVLSPVGRALLGHEAGRALEFALPSGARQRIEILGVRAAQAAGEG